MKVVVLPPKTKVEDLPVRQGDPDSPIDPLDSEVATVSRNLKLLNLLPDPVPELLIRQGLGDSNRRRHLILEVKVVVEEGQDVPGADDKRDEEPTKYDCRYRPDAARVPGCDLT